MTTEAASAGLGGLLGDLLTRVRPETSAGYSPDELDAIADELLSDAVARQWTAEQMAQTKVRTLDFRNGVDMELEPAQDLAASLVAAARTLLGGADNYVEATYASTEYSAYSMTVSIPELPERYTLTIQRVAPGKCTPHEARVRAEEAIAAVWGLISDGAACDAGALGRMLERHGFPAPPGDEGEG